MVALQRFVVSAPGKVILHGEHSVVYGKPAIAGPIALRTNLTYQTLDQPDVELDFASIGFVSSLPLSSFNAFLQEYDCHRDVQPDAFLARMRSGDEEFVFAKYVRQAPDEPKARFSLATALYLLNRVLHSEKIVTVPNGFRMSINSTMSIGAGLGSSASYGVCLAAGAYLLAQIINGSLTQASSVDDCSLQRGDGEVLRKISAWAFDSEVIMHEKPSGIDNTICTYGKLIKFRRGEPFEDIDLRQRLHILIVDTGVSRATSNQVAKVRTRKERHPATMDAILDAMGHLVDEVTDVLQSDGAQHFERLRTLVAMNNNLLRAVGASHPSLDRILLLAEEGGFEAKLTGAGGGGCAFVLLPPDYAATQEYARLTDALTEAGFVWMPTEIDGQGVEVVELG